MSYDKLKKIREIYPDLLFLLLIMTVGLLSITWFRGDFLVNPGDTNFLFNPPHDLYRSLFVWDHQQGFGRIDSMATAKIFPYNILLDLLSLLGISIYGSQKILFYLIFTSSGLTAYFLIKYLLASKSYNRIAALLGANFYMMNTYLIQLRWGSGYLMGLFFYAVFPFIVLMWFKGRSTKDIKFSIYMILGCLLALPSLNNPAYIVPLLVICALDLLILLFRDIRSKVKFISLSKYVFVTTLIFVFALSFWVLSIAITFEETSINLLKSTLQFRQEVITSSKSSVLNLFRNLGDWGFLGGDHFGDLYYPYSPLYSSPLFIIISFAILFLSFAPLFSLRKQNTEEKYTIILFSLVFLIGVWLSKGIRDPLGGIYKWTVHNIPLASALRAAYEKAGTLMVISTAVLIAFMLAIVLQGVKVRNGRIALILLLFSLINIYAWPFWTGDIWRSQTKVLPGFRFQIPNYYYDLKKYLDEPNCQAYRILQLPDNATPVPYIVTLNLNGRLYSGSDPLSRMLKTPLIYLNPFNFIVSENITSALFRSYSTNLDDFVGKINNLSKILNIKSILLRNDSDNTIYPNIKNPKEIKPLLSSFALEKSFGPLDLYKISDQYFLPHIYPSVTPILIKGSLDDMLEVVTSDNFAVGNNVLFLSDQVSKSQWEFLKKHSEGESSYTPTITFQKINPTRYEVKVENATSPFFLVFSESYHPEWKAYIEDKSFVSGDVIAYYQNVNVKEVNHNMKFTPGDVLYLFKESVNDDEHFLANGYANTWYIDPKEIGEGNFTITLYFRPQSYFYLGLFISGFTLISCFGYLLYSWYKFRKQNKITQVKICGRQN